MINPTGYTALDLVGFTDKGTYASNVNYVKNDIVHYGGNLWRCLIDDTMNVTPAEGNNWTVFVGEPTNLVERIIAPLEENPATVAYATGRQIIYDDWLWEVIDDIAVGDPLIDYAVDPTNANIKKAVPVETQLLDVKKKEGNLTDLHTTNKTNLVAAVNEVKDDLDDLSDDVGTLSALDTNVKTSTVAAINEVNTKVSKTEVLISNSGDAYSSSKAYAVGELCIYNNVLYRCITACSAGSWATNQSCFTATTLTKEANTLKGDLSDIGNNASHVYFTKNDTKNFYALQYRFVWLTMRTNNQVLDTHIIPKGCIGSTPYFLGFNDGTLFRAKLTFDIENNTLTCEILNGAVDVHCYGIL